VQPGKGYLIHRHGFLCATRGVELGGEIVTYDLAPGETLQVHPGHVGMFEETVNFDVTFLKGISNVFFGGDGLFVSRLTGPGKVWLQSLTLPNLAHAIAPYLGQAEAKTATQAGVTGGIAGNIMRDMFGGNR
jgi:uncharacterized protein (AIM24 family)